MKKYILIPLLCLLVQALSAQARKNYYAVGVEVATPVYTAVGKLSGVSLGAFAQRQWRWSNRWAGTASIGYNYFTGTITNQMEEKENNYAVVPVLAGLRYYPWEKWYAAMEAGVSIKAHQNAVTKFTYGPSAGVVLPFYKKHIDLGIRFTTVPMGFGHPEQKLLQRGGYSFLGMRAAILF